MDLTGIISISGKAGLYKVVARSKNNIIIESLTDQKRMPAYSTDKISALEDISIYTYENDIPLKEVYVKIAEKEDCKAILSHKESLEKLTAYIREILPEYDEERVYSSDIKKIIQWYNLLHKEGLIKLEAEDSEEKIEGEKPKKEVVKKAPAKKVVPVEKKTATKQAAVKKVVKKVKK